MMKTQSYKKIEAAICLTFILACGVAAAQTGKAAIQNPTDSQILQNMMEQLGISER